MRDSLTGLFNRSYLDESLKQEIIKAKRYQQPLSLIMLYHVRRQSFV
nr:diguanylate cyclase [Okeania sp. SIO2C9]